MQKVKLSNKLAKVDAALDRWQPRLTRAVNTFVELVKQRKRILAQIAEVKAKPKAVKPKVSDVTEVTELAYALPDVLRQDYKTEADFRRALKRAERGLTGKVRQR